MRPLDCRNPGRQRAHHRWHHVSAFDHRDGAFPTGLVAGERSRRLPLERGGAAVSGRLGGGGLLRRAAPDHGPSRRFSGAGADRHRLRPPPGAESILSGTIPIGGFSGGLDALRGGAGVRVQGTAPSGERGRGHARDPRERESFPQRPLLLARRPQAFVDSRGDLRLSRAGDADPVRATAIGIPAIGFIPGARYDRLDRGIVS
jgi:hypothetical protein